MDQTRLDRLFTFLQRAPEDAFTLYSIAYEYVQMAEWDEALNYFTKLKALHPDYVGLYYHLGKTYERLDQKETAISTYEEGLVVAQKQKDFHARSELQRALNQATGLDFEDDF
ncbi:MAG: tetratricopeptide repeat protein [Bacteroidota bacterium]